MNQRILPIPATGTRERLVVATASLFAAWLSFVSTSVRAADLRPYNDIPLVGSDFKMTVPSPLPLLANGATQRALISTGIGLASSPTSCLNRNGGWVCTVTSVTYTANMNRDESWISEPGNKDMLDHEQGHLDEAAAAAKKAQAEADKKIKDGTLKGEGKTKEDALADLLAKVKKIADDNKKAVEDPNGDGIKDYDHDTGHGTDGKKQKEARARQQAALKSPSTEAQNKTGSQAASETTRSIAFIASSRRLIIDHDFITSVSSTAPGFVPDPLDVVLGAEVQMPPFILLGLGANGDWFFAADTTDARLQIVGAGGVLLTAGLPYLQYDPVLNLFYGLSGGFESVDGVSQFIDQLVADLVIGEPALFGIEFRPDRDFITATAGFSNDATSAASNLAGLRLLNVVDEPHTLGLVGFAVLLLMGEAANRRRRRHGVRSYALVPTRD